MATRLKNMMAAVQGMLTKMTETKPTRAAYQIGRGQKTVDVEHRRIIWGMRAQGDGAIRMREVVAHRAAQWADPKRDRSRERPYSMGGRRLPNPPKKTIIPYRVRQRMRAVAEMEADQIIQTRKSEGRPIPAHRSGGGELLA